MRISTAPGRSPCAFMSRRGFGGILSMRDGTIGPLPAWAADIGLYRGLALGRIGDFVREGTPGVAAPSNCGRAATDDHRTTGRHQSAEAPRLMQA